MKEQSEVDVLICGAGAAGLTLAIDLARRGVSFRLIEKLDTPFHGSRGKGIQPRTQEIFENLAILNRIAAIGGDYPLERKYYEDGSFSDSAVIEHHNLTPTEPYSFPLMIPQFLTESVLRERLMELGHSPEFGCELVGFEEDRAGVKALISNKGREETLRVQWLVGADGGRSFIRHSLNIDFPGKTLGVRAIVADVMLTGLTRDVWHRFNDGDMLRQISFCPLAGTEMFQIQGPIPIDGNIDLSAEGLEAMVLERTGHDNIRIQSVYWASAYNMNARLAEHYRTGRVFLVGDAAHIHPPTGGQGLNTSVQDAYNLSWKLAAVVNGAPEALLDSYEEERRPVAAEMLGLSTKLLEAAKQGEMRRGREVQQLDIGYPKSSLAFEQPRRIGGLFAGDRAPDALVRGAANQLKRMFDLFQGGHWTLIGYGVERNAVLPRPGLHIHAFGPRGDIFDAESNFYKAYAPAVGDWILVRPDGYIGAIVATSNLAMLENYLAQVGLGTI